MLFSAYSQVIVSAPAWGPLPLPCLPLRDALSQRGAASLLSRFLQVSVTREDEFFLPRFIYLQNLPPPRSLSHTTAS